MRRSTLISKSLTRKYSVTPTDKLHLLFPGQGSQRPGMGKDLFENFVEAREVFQEVEEALKYKISDVMFEGSEVDVRNTEIAQPAIFTHSVATLRVLQKFVPDFDSCIGSVMGHSVGEYAALVAAKSLSVSDGAKLLSLRAKSMQASANEQIKKANSPVAMQALLLSPPTDTVPSFDGQLPQMASLVRTANWVSSVCTEVTAANPVMVCGVAGINSPTQLVLSGDESALKSVIARLQGEENTSYPRPENCQSIRRAVPLSVSCPFHTSILMPSAIIMDRVIKKSQPSYGAGPEDDSIRAHQNEVYEQIMAELGPGYRDIRVSLKNTANNIPFISNVRAEPITTADAIRNALVDGITKPVKFAQSIAFAYQELNAVNFLELGCGSVLSNLVHQTLPGPGSRLSSHYDGRAAIVCSAGVTTEIEEMLTFLTELELKTEE